MLSPLFHLNWLCCSRRDSRAWRRGMMPPSILQRTSSPRGKPVVIMIPSRCDWRMARAGTGYRPRWGVGLTGFGPGVLGSPVL